MADFTGDGRADVIGVERISCGENDTLCYNGMTDLSALYASSSSYHLLATVENGIRGVVRKADYAKQSVI